MDPHFTYILRDAEGRVLWVGQTEDPVGRIRSHRSRQPWRQDIADVELVRHANRKDALREEHRLIRTLQPAYNRMGITYNVFGEVRTEDRPIAPKAVRVPRPETYERWRDGESMQAIANDLGLCRQRISQIIAEENPRWLIELTKRLHQARRNVRKAAS